jgi:crossover junction endodeoxyribonuclease RusA
VIEIELPYPPSVNHYYRNVGPRTLISREGRRYRERVQAQLAALGIRPLSGRLVVRVEVYPPDNRRRDLDNLQKSLWDALQHGGAAQSGENLVDAHHALPAPSGYDYGADFLRFKHLRYVRKSQSGGHGTPCPYSSSTGED